MRAIRALAAVAVLSAALVAGLDGGASDARPRSRRAAPPVVPTISFAESWFESPDVAAGRCVVDATIPLDPADVATFNADTFFQIDVGGFSFNATLSDDSSWTQGDTSATFKDFIEDDDGNPDVQLVARLRWTSTKLVVHVVARTGDLFDPIVCDMYEGAESGAVGPDESLDQPAELGFGNAYVDWDTVPSSGRVRNWERGDETYSLIRMSGRATK